RGINGSKPVAYSRYGRCLVRPDRFELPTFWFVARRSIQLSYGRSRPQYNSGVCTRSFAYLLRYVLRRLLEREAGDAVSPRAFCSIKRLIGDSNIHFGTTLQAIGNRDTEAG